MSECRCGKPTRDDAYLCDGCGDELGVALGDVTWLDEELEVTITRQRAIPTEGGSAGAETALPWHQAASEARRHLKALLVSWALFCDEEGVRCQDPHDGLPADNLVALSRWMLWRVDGLTLHELGPDAHDEITSAVNDCRRLIDRRPERWYAGPCIALTLAQGDGTCGTDLYARSQRGTVECPECEATYDVAERRGWLLEAAEDRLVNATDLARAVSWLGAEPLSPSRVWKWAERGRIVAHGRDGKSPLYRVGDALDLLASDTARPDAGVG